VLRLGLPRGTLITMVKRDSGFIAPSGSTVVLGGDRLVVLARTPELLDEPVARLGLVPLGPVQAAVPGAA